MFYEEKVIDGILHYRTRPYATWTPYTIQELTSRYEQLKEQYANVNRRVGELEQENRRLADLLSEKVEHLIVREAFSAKYGDHLIVTKGKVPYFKPTPAEEGKPEPPREEGRRE